MSCLADNLEWYDPRQVTTKDGKLVITLDKIVTNNMNYTGGLLSTWNKVSRLSLAGLNRT